jgi:hypothetical protein
MQRWGHEVVALEHLARDLRVTRLVSADETETAQAIKEEIAAHRGNKDQLTRRGTRAQLRSDSRKQWEKF